MRAAVVTLFLLVSPGGAFGAEPRLGRLSPAQVDTFLAEVQQAALSFPERIERVSARLLGTRYVRDPLGEGKAGRQDPDPLVDLGKVDCLTFVEQVLALSQRATLRQATDLLQRYRYEGGEVAYPRRRHFMELQWLPGLARAALLRDVTASVAGEAVRLFERPVTRSSYRGAFRKWPRKLGCALPLGEIRLAYLPATRAPAFADRIRPGTVLALLRRTPDSWPVVITHVGFVVRRRGQFFFRHAIHVAGRVIDERLDRYLGRHASDPRSLGFHLAEPLAAPLPSAPSTKPK